MRPHARQAARIVLRQLRAHPERVERVEDIAIELPALAPLRGPLLEEAVAELVAAGAIGEAADGRLLVQPERTAA